MGKRISSINDAERTGEVHAKDWNILFILTK